MFSFVWNQKKYTCIYYFILCLLPALGFCMADKVFWALIVAACVLESLVCGSGQLQAQWNESEGYSEKTLLLLHRWTVLQLEKAVEGSHMQGAFSEPRELLTRQVPRADPAGLFTPALVDICLGVSSLWRRLCLTFKFIFHESFC